MSRLARRSAVWLVTAALASVAPVVFAADTTPGGTVYVTDQLRLGLYRTEETTGRALKTLVSGEPLEILERSLMSIRVRTEAGDEGWVKTAYVVDDEPAVRRLAALQQGRAELDAAMAAAEASRAEALTRADALDAELATVKQGIVDLPELRAENESLKAALNQAGPSVPLLWLLVACVISLALGAFAGYQWLDRRVRSKFGGHRVY